MRSIGRGGAWGGGKTARLGWIVAMAGALWIGSVASGGEGDEAAEPTVTGREAALLREVEELARRAPAEAIERLRSAIDESSSPALLFALATFEHEEGRDPEAVASLRGALGRMPGFRRARENLARILLADGKWDEGAEEILVLLGRAGEDAGELWKLLGYARLSAGDPVSAETAYRAALVRSPRDAESRMGLVKALMDEGNLAASRTLLAAALEENPLGGDLWGLLAEVDLASGRKRDALVRLECARRLGVASPQALVTLGSLDLAEGLVAEGIDVLEECAGLEDAPAERLLDAAAGLARIGRAAEARNLLERLEGGAGPPEGALRRKWRSVRAAVEEAQGRPAEALVLYRRILERDPLDGEALLAAARLLRGAGKLEEALVLLERAERVSPEQRADALLGQAQIAVEREEYERAATLLERSLTIRRRPHVERYLEQVRRMLE